jgi:hypothetical protein
MFLWSRPVAGCRLQIIDYISPITYYRLFVSFDLSIVVFSFTGFASPPGFLNPFSAFKTFTGKQSLRAEAR